MTEDLEARFVLEITNLTIPILAAAIAFFGGGSSSGASASLPLEDDYTALRQAIWWTVDDDYKSSVETLTKKRAYMKDKTFEDRPNDFSKASVVEHQDTSVEFSFDKEALEKNLKKISGVFVEYKQLQIQMSS